ncbi:MULTISPECIES: hypothetical protein [Burkholderia]|uniref:Uncharacterized protein n=2 Tax=Burkholderia cepacia complex TaxID=87882 RepID=A0AAP4RAM8_9BURK|nr:MULTISPECIES: hypothetical protein [Burkholderia]VBB17489.1 hypothetical protein BSTAB16_7708 [Burkholderia stabilis]MBD1415199.1 hypothetical protein [Burkholderia contaminans]MBH9694106.1 hypothetical protein [Burkholderia contaminans]MBM6431300.1 hypothetical protein [Burkholderia contaminans]MCA7880966.1 hypothetical protein [Burkholderia contaminans]
MTASTRPTKPGQSQPSRSNAAQPSATPDPVIHARAVKVSVVVDVERFPFDAVPPVGTPGAKNAQLPFSICTPAGRIVKTTLKGGTLQRFVQAVRDNPAGGAAVIAGRISDDGKSILDAGITFQPKAIEATATE